MEAIPFGVAHCAGRDLRQRRRIGSGALFSALVAVIVSASVPTPSRGDIFYGLADTTLGVDQLELDGVSGYKTLRTWNLPVAVTFRVETDFASSELLGIDLNIHETIYEDVSHNFEFSFGIEGSIFGDGPVDIDIVPGTDEWVSELYWDALDAELMLDRRVFSSTTHFERDVFDDTVRFANDRFNFNGYPGSITHLRQVAGNYWPLESVPYSDIGKLGFYLYSPGTVTLAPAICDDPGCADYNQNGIVDAADYTVWRDTLGESGADLAGDGNSNGWVEIADYEVWKMHFGATSGELDSGWTIVPEPSAVALMIVAVAALTRPCLVGGRRFIR